MIQYFLGLEIQNSVNSNTYEPRRFSIFFHIILSFCVIIIAKRIEIFFINHILCLCCGTYVYESSSTINKNCYIRKIQSASLLMFGAFIEHQTMFKCKFTLKMIKTKALSVILQYQLQKQLN